MLLFSLISLSLIPATESNTQVQNRDWSILNELTLGSDDTSLIVKLHFLMI